MDTEQKIDAELIRLAERMAVIFRKRKELTEEASDIYEASDAIGITPAMLRLGVQWVKIMSKGERGDAQRSLKRVVDVIGTRQRELFPEETERQEKKAAAAKKRAQEAAAIKGVDADTNPRSDPKRGGAGRKPAAKKAASSVRLHGEADPDSVDVRNAAEQAEGEAALSGMTPETQAAQSSALNADGTPKSQSQISQEKLEAAKLN